MEKLNNTLLLGRPMTITNDEEKIKGRGIFSCQSVFFKNLDKDIDERELYNVVNQIGPVASIKVSFCS